MLAYRLVLAILPIAGVVSRVAHAQSDSVAACQRAGTPCPPVTSNPAQMTVRSSTTAIALDPKLTDAIWLSADSITEFRQRAPAAGAQATQRTVAKGLAIGMPVILLIVAFVTWSIAGRTLRPVAEAHERPRAPTR